ncbi:MAG: hypothetical protein WBD16_11805 [Pyrinomonadaceae bacterium]
MSRFNSPLNNVKVASPCPASWDAMYGDERKRFCGECKLNVYNLSDMTRDEAEQLITNNEGRLCVRFYRRADGSVITADCPVGWAKVKHRTRAAVTAAASLVMALFTGVLVSDFFSGRQSATVGKIAPFERTMGAIAVQGEPVAPRRQPDANFELGKMKALTEDEKKRLGS